MGPSGCSLPAQPWDRNAELAQRPPVRRLRPTSPRRDAGSVPRGPQLAGSPQTPAPTSPPQHPWRRNGCFGSEGKVLQKPDGRYSVVRGTVGWARVPFAGVRLCRPRAVKQHMRMPVLSSEGHG